MKNDLFSKIVLFFLISILLFMTFFPLLKTGLTTQDDMRIQIENLSRQFNTKYLTDTGRTNIVGLIIGRIPYHINNYLYLKVVSVTSTLINIVLAGLLIHYLFGSAFLVLVYILFLTLFLQNSWQYNLLTAYPFAFTFTLNLLFLSIIFFIKFLQTRKVKYQIFSVLLYLPTLFHYETYLTYISVFIFLSLFGSGQLKIRQIFSTKNLINAVKNCLPHIILVGAYLSLYLFVSSKHVNVNVDYKFSEFSIKRTLKVFYYLWVSTIPTYIYFHSYEFFNTVSQTITGQVGNMVDLFKNARIEWLIKAAIGVFVLNTTLFMYPIKLTSMKILKILVLSMLLAFLPMSLHSLTMKYQHAVDSGIVVYAISYFSYFGTVLLIVGLLGVIFRLAKQKYFRYSLAIVFSTVLFVSIVLIEYSNYHYTFSQTQSQLKWDAVHYLVNTSQFKEIPEGSIIFAPTLFEYRPYSYAVPHDTYWSEYIKLLTGKIFTVTDTLDDININKMDTIYYLKFSQEMTQPIQYLLLTKPNNILSIGDQPVFYSDNALLINYSSSKSFILSLGYEIGNENLKSISVNENFYYSNSNYFSKIITSPSGISQNVIKSSQIFNVDSINLSFLTDHYSENPDLISFQGFYSLENDGNNSWRWSPSESSIVINNPIDSNINIKISMEIITLDDKKSKLNLSGNLLNETLELSNSPLYYSRAIIVPAGLSTIALNSDARIFNMSGRNLVFYVRNFKIEQ